jgi:hypothetical protein
MKLIEAGIFGPLNGLTSGPHASGEMVRNLVSCGGGLAGEFVSVYCTEGQRAIHIATDGGRPQLL